MEYINILYYKKIINIRKIKNIHIPKIIIFLNL